ncbi:MAG: 1-deoxy-D-xylulose-5-phosphate reductoisomerase [Gammaproteobacteria bacterium]|nr:1-deoxy-D-xylulose-5-phosphate reductoisomerase [Gammaproteobacteria bacterium]
MYGVTILGSTGTIGANTLDVIGRHPAQYELVALAANKDVKRLHEQCLRWRPRFAVMADPASAAALRGWLATDAAGIEVLAGVDGLIQVATLPDVQQVMAAIVGAAGLIPTLAAARAGKRVLLANKEALVMSGRIFMDAVRENGAKLLPIDSEHNALFQCMPLGFADGLERAGVTRIVLTASGGPFRTLGLADLERVTPDQACAHPNWVMGRKISVDSATMMNKGLEIIEACWLFNTTPERVQVVIHPQSVIHSLVQYADGSVLAQLGNPDMRTPIAHALAWPQRMDSGVAALDLAAVGRLDFEEPDMDRFPCLRLAREAMAAGGTATAILNAANEVAVAEFLAGKLRFTGIPRIVEAALESVAPQDCSSLEAVLEADRAAREFASSAAHGLAA